MATGVNEYVQSGYGISVTSQQINMASEPLCRHYESMYNAGKLNYKNQNYGEVDYVAQCIQTKD